jgi:signal transduction histidine kinase
MKQRAARLAVLALALLAAEATARAESPLPERVLAHGTFRLGDAKAPPPDLASGDPVVLPDRWPERRAAVSGVGWYRLPFALDTVPDRPLAVLLPHVSMNAAVRLNGSWVGQGGRMEEPVGRSWSRPLRFPLPAGLLRAGENALEIAVVRLPDCYGGLAPVHVGDAAALAAAERRALLWQVELPKAVTVAGFVLALVMLAFWIGARDPSYAAFGLTTALLVIHNLNYHVRESPLPWQAWEALSCSAIVLAAPAFAAFAHRLVGVARPRLERLLWGAGLLSLALFAVPHRFFHPLFNALALGALAVATYAVALLVAHSWRHDRASLVVYLVAGAAGLAILVRDLAFQLGALRAPSAPWMPLAIPVIFAGYALTLVRRFVAAFRRAEQQRDVLAHEQVLALERERIMREMHDGVGSHLVRTLSMLEGRAAAPSELARSLRAALDDMRLVIDSLDPGLGDLGSVLGSVRERLEPGVVREGLRFEWRLGELPALSWLGPEQSLHVLRILQEAIANALRHAGATQIRVECGAEAGAGGEAGVFVAIEDDGQGMPEAPAHGRGLLNLAHRAAALAGRLRVGRGHAGRGTRVHLWLPLGGPPV